MHLCVHSYNKVETTLKITGINPLSIWMDRDSLVFYLQNSLYWLCLEYSKPPGENLGYNEDCNKIGAILRYVQCQKVRK